jgi:phosphodiesterase/alkaline phosphatase D-like protein
VHKRMLRTSDSRRLFLKRTVGVGAAQALASACATSVLADQSGAPAIVTSERLRPQIPYGAMTGDLTSDRAIVWSKTDRPAQMIVELDCGWGCGGRKRVVGPINAGTFGPNALDLTFGPEVKFASLPPGTKPNRPPSEGLQFFGLAEIDDKSSVMHVELRNLNGETLYAVDLEPRFS